MATIGEAAIFAANVYFTENTPKGAQVKKSAPIGVPAGWRLDKVIDPAASLQPARGRVNPFIDINRYFKDKTRT